MKRYAIAFAATGPEAGRNYLPDTNALLNSIQKRQLKHHIGAAALDVYLFYHGFPKHWSYPERAQRAFDFNLKPVELRREDIPHPAGTNPIEFVKRARYFKLMEIAGDYDAVCLLDADMFCVAEEFGGLFEMVAGTRKMIAANERIKWYAGPGAALDYFVGEERIFPEPTRLHSMVCNVPCIVDMHEWRDVFDYYCEIAFDGHQIKDGHRVGIGDLFAHNTAIHVKGRAGDVIPFPMGCMAQVHHVWRSPWHYLINDGGRWRTWDGDRVYMIHDSKKLADPKFLPGNMAEYNREWEGWAQRGKFGREVEKGLRAAQREWWELNFASFLDLYQFLPHNEFWDSLGKD